MSVRGITGRPWRWVLALALVCAGQVTAGSAIAPPALADASPAPAGSSQLITVNAPTSGSTTATVTAWQRGPDGMWRAAIGPVPARVGSGGIGHASEGSDHTPAGTFALTQAFGRQNNPGTRMPYFRTDAWDWWDENPSSPTYNLHVRQAGSPGGASENLYYSGSVYDYVVNMDYNMARVPGAGSAFFLHVSDGTPTAGCVSVDRSVMVAILRWLDPARHPSISIRVGTPWQPYLPTGFLDSVRPGVPGQLVATGWAADRSSPTVREPVHLYVYGPAGPSNYYGAVTGRSRPDVLRAYPWAGGSTGFSQAVRIRGHGVNTVCAYAISIRAPSRHTLLGCRSIRA